MKLPYHDFALFHRPHFPGLLKVAIVDAFKALRSIEMTEDKRNILDHYRRQLAAKFELKRKLYKAVCNDPSLPNDVREEHRYKLSKLPRNSSFTRLRNRCIFTGRPRGVYQLFRVSHIG
ncbi:Ribosomal protein S14, mitochondrial, partial [Cucurbita argyrosperma subsp. sororia]